MTQFSLPTRLRGTGLAGAVHDRISTTFKQEHGTYGSDDSEDLQHNVDLASTRLNHSAHGRRFDASRHRRHLVIIDEADLIVK